MVPREEIVALSTENDFEENLAIMADHSHSRYPLVDEDSDDYRGIVYLPAITNHFDDLANGTTDIEDVAVHDNAAGRRGGQRRGRSVPGRKPGVSAATGNQLRRSPTPDRKPVVPAARAGVVTLNPLCVHVRP